MKSFEQLLVFNIYTSVSDLAKAKKDGSVLLLSSHALFPEEQRSIANAFGECELKFIRFDAYNHFLETEDLDRQAFEINKKWIPYTSIYHSRYFRSISYLKNKFLFRHLLNEGLIDEKTKITAFCQSYELHNLGLSQTFWKETEAHIIERGPDSNSYLWRKRITSLLPVSLALYFLKALFLAIKPRTLYEVNDGESYLIYSLKRLKLKDELSISSRLISPLIAQKKNYLAAGIHSNADLLATYPFISRDRMVMIQDAFRPSSYPPYYYANTFNGCKLAGRDQIDRGFFGDAGIDLLPKGTLLKANALQEHIQHSLDEIKTVCLSLNHAGNWTSFISRCDTDGPIVEFMDLASSLPKLNFIIRLHPNSNNKKAEGKGWIERIKEQIRVAGLSNLNVSDLSIEEDWKRCDIFISEYSLSVVDALLQGKLAVFINTTKRRSFVRDLTDVGFREVESFKELYNYIIQCIEDPYSAQLQLLECVRRYNVKYVKD